MWSRYALIPLVVVITCAAGWLTYSHFRFGGSVTGPLASASVEVPAYRLTVSGATGLSVAATRQPAAAVPRFAQAVGPAVTVALPGGGQPGSALTVKFDFNGKPPPPASDAVVPAVAVIGEGSTQPEVLRSQWDPTNHTLTAQTQHLSSFIPISINFTVLGDQFSRMLNGYKRLASGKPACVGQPLVVADTTYTLDPPTVSAAYPCLSAGADKISVDLASNSPNGWIVHSSPPTTDMALDLTPDVSNWFNETAYRSLFSGVVNDGTFLLPGETTQLRFSANRLPQTIGLRADPGVSLLNGLLLDLSALYPNAAVLNIPGMVECLKPAVAKASTDPADIGGDTGALIDCITKLTDTLSTKRAPGVPVSAVTIATKSLGAVLSLGPNIAGQLAADLRDALGELTAKNTHIINVHAGTH